MGFPDSLNFNKMTDLGKKFKKSEGKMSKKKLKTICLAKCTPHKTDFEMCESDAEHEERNGSLKESPKIAEIKCRLHRV